MARVLAILVLMLPCLAWSRVRSLLTQEGVAAAMRQLGPALRNDPLAAVAFRLREVGVTEREFVAVSLFAALAIAALGYFCDYLLGRKGFGPLGNSALLLVGVMLASAAWLTLAPPALLSIRSLDVFVVALAGGLTLLFAAWLRQIAFLRFDGFATGLGAPGKRRAPPPGRSAADVLRRSRR